MAVKINVRSPYFIKAQNASLKAIELNLYIWDGVEGSTPASAQYSFVKNTIGSNDYIAFEIADYVRDYIVTEYNQYATNAVWVQWDYQMFDNVSRAPGTEIGTAVTSSAFLAVDGYGFFEDGAMPSLSNDLLQDNLDIYYNDGSDIVFALYDEGASLVQLGDGDVNVVYWEQVEEYWDTYNATWDSGGTEQVIGDSTDSFNKIVYVKITDTANLPDKETVTITLAPSGTKTLNLYKICEPKYTPFNIIFYNKYGAMQNLWFFKRSNKSLNITSDSFKRNTIDFASTPTYNTAEHQVKSFNVNAKESITLNTGFLPEDFNKLITQLLMSEEVWIDNGSQVLPVTPKTSSLEYKTSVNNKLIDYSLEFEYAFDKINNIR